MNKTKAATPDPLDTLLAMPLRKRIAAVASDVASGADKFSEIDAFDLADALGVPEPDQPSPGEWAFRSVAPPTLEEYFENSGETEMFDMLVGQIDAVRAEVLKEAFRKLDDVVAKPSLHFLSAAERAFLEVRIAELTLKADQDDGACRIATYIVNDGMILLHFEAEVTDGGATIALRTPYDHRDGLFLGSPSICH